MRTTWILIEKELRTAFDSWMVYTGYLLFCLICGFACWLSPSNLFALGQANMLFAFTMINWTVFLLIQASAIRSISDEKRNGTLELLLTKPITTSQLIAAKFWSQLLIVMLAILLTIPYYITIASLGHIDHGSVVTGYLGLVCVSACYISIAIFASACSKTPISAFFVSLGIGLCFQVLFGLLSQQFATGFLADLFAFLAIGTHYEPMSRGIIDTRDLIYLLSVILSFLYMARLSVCKIRY